MDTSIDVLSQLTTGLSINHDNTQQISPGYNGDYGDRMEVDEPDIEGQFSSMSMHNDAVVSGISRGSSTPLRITRGASFGISRQTTGMESDTTLQRPGASSVEATRPPNSPSLMSNILSPTQMGAHVALARAAEKQKIKEEASRTPRRGRSSSPDVLPNCIQEPPPLPLDKKNVDLVESASTSDSPSYSAPCLAAPVLASSDPDSYQMLPPAGTPGEVAPPHIHMPMPMPTYTWMHAHSHVAKAYVFSTYLQLLFNTAVWSLGLYVIGCGLRTFWDDVDKVADQQYWKRRQEISSCAQNYFKNECAAHTRRPALDELCNQWQIGMSMDPHGGSRLAACAQVFANTINHFFDSIPMRNFLMAFVLSVSLMFVTNFLFGYIRAKLYYAKRYKPFARSKKLEVKRLKAA